MAKETTYINNPLKIGVDGSKLLFQKAPMTALLLAVLSGLGATNHFGGSTGPIPSSESTPAPVDGSLDPIAFVFIAFLIIVFAFGFLVLGSIINGVASYTAVEIAHGREVTFRQALSATIDRLWSFVWLQLLTVLKVAAWSLLLIVPGIIMAIRYSLANLSFFDEKKKLTGNAAIKDSLALTNGAWLTTFAGQTLFSIITLGAIAPIVDTGSKAALYRQFSTLKADEAKPKPHTLSWVTLGVSIIILVILLATFAYGIASAK